MTPLKAARERAELAVIYPETVCCSVIDTADLRLILAALDGQEVTHTDQLGVADYLREIAKWSEHGAFMAAGAEPNELAMAQLGKHFQRLKEMADYALRIRPAPPVEKDNG